MAFGRPTRFVLHFKPYSLYVRLLLASTHFLNCLVNRYWQLSNEGISDADWDAAVEKASREYSKRVVRCCQW